MNTRQFVAAAVLLACTFPAHATITYTNQSRFVQTNSVEGNLMQAAPDFGPFDRIVSLHGGTFGSISVGPSSASQNSTLDPTRISATGSVQASDANALSGSSSHSLLDVSFTVDEPSPFRLIGSWTSVLPTNYPGAQPTHLEVVFDGVRQTGWFSIDGPFADAVDVQGSLAVGVHRLIVDFQWGLAIPGSLFEPATASYNVLLSVPSPTTSSALVAGATWLCSSRRRR